MSRCRWFQYSHGEYRKGTSYIKNKDHKKKPKRDTAWRVEQGNAKKQDRGRRCGHPCQPKSKKIYQRYANRKLRMYVKTKTYNEDWDAIPVGSHPYKWVFRDPWDWD